MQCLPPYHVPVGKLRWLLDRDYFANDAMLIQAVADCTSVSEVSVELCWHRASRPPYGFQRGFLRARVSGQRLLDLASSILPAK